ncbi:acetyltransferase gnat family protein [Cordyceps fumosorosea ARSEF 2679]|uniref:Acetyltransferase gnat family protein n=1 Tax=Cordyceps fumosorosea (strain ARSEF 2679) TaxID=1081104 RepID=A0A162MDK9_CORFA|nr:acetyltransferase gnat family protein [Cordyceps fumosorosea ARSEF 2679]OAA54660.1 acetyltransferase gnat family protein [Cordyceps fumosorosea ARSEF 2679]
MTVSEEPWTSTAPEAAHIQLVQIPLAALEALAANDLPSARTLSGIPNLTPYTSSAAAPWVTRLVVDGGAVVGRAGFHGPPDERGMVEVGYSIDPACRRRGHARAALRVMLDVAAADERVKVVRASIGPGNEASMGVVRPFGFKEVGEQWDEEDGLETILEVEV